MSKIFFIGDTHFGKPYSFLKDYELNFSKRNFDVINNCEKIIHTAIEENADLVVFLGDLYERHTISPTIRKIVREKIFIPLYEANVPVLILGGNHDSIRYPTRGADIQELANFPNVEVYTEFDTKIMEFNGTKLGLLILPYIHFDVLVEMARTSGMAIPKEQNNYAIAQFIIKKYVKQIYEQDLKQCEKKILIGHYYVDGAKIREISNPITLYGEFKFNKEMMQRELFDLIIFGHVHMMQTMWNDERIILPGSIDRLDMGERDSEKYYCVYEIQKDQVEFRPIECRSLFKIEIDIPENEKNLTEYILNQLPDKINIKDALCKIIIHFPKGKELQIDKIVLEEYVKSTFHTEFSYSEKAGKELEYLRKINLDPKSLFLDYMEQKYATHSYYEDLKKLGINILEERLKSIAVPVEGPLSLKALNIQNFNNYGKGPNRILFENDVYVIKGPTGAGKSSLLDAITFALFKRSTRKDAGMNLEDILYEKGYVELELMIGDKLFSIKRNYSNPKLQIKLNGEELYKGLKITEKERKIEEIIGYDYDSFISSFFIRQQELQIFSLMSSGDRQDILTKLFKLKIFQEAEKSLKDVITTFTNQKENLEGQLKILQETVGELPQLERSLETYKSELQEKDKKKTEVSKEVEQIKKKIESLSGDTMKYMQAKKIIEELEGNIVKDKKELEKYQKSQEDYRELQKRLEEFKETSTEKDILYNKKEEISSKKQERDQINSKIQANERLLSTTGKQFDSQLKTLTDQITNKEYRIKALKLSLTKEEAFDILREEGKLSERVERLQKVEIPMAKEYKDTKKITEFKAIEQKSIQEMQEITPKEQFISKDIFLAEEIQIDKQSLEQQYQETEQKKRNDLKQLQQEKENYTTFLKERDLLKDFEDELKTLEGQLKIIKQKEKEKQGLESQLSTKKDFAPLIERIKAELSELDMKLNHDKKERDVLESSYQQYLEFSTKFGNKQEELKEIEKKMEGIQQSIKHIEEEINKFKAKIIKIKDTQKKIKETTEKLEKNTILRKEIFHLNGVPKFAIEKIIPAIALKASEILSDLTNGRLSQISFKSLEGKRVGFEIFAFDGEKERDVSTYSGGEKTQINAAIRFAIMERIADIPDTTGAIFRKSDTLLIDEGDLGTLDDETSRQLFVDKILKLKSMFKNIILITHLEDVAEQFPNRIKIGRDEYGKSKIF